MSGAAWGAFETVCRSSPRKAIRTEVPCPSIVFLLPRHRGRRSRGRSIVMATFELLGLGTRVPAHVPRAEPSDLEFAAPVHEPGNRCQGGNLARTFTKTCASLSAAARVCLRNLN